MPNINTTMYVTDEEYTNYFMPQKKEILKLMRETVRKEMYKKRGKNNENKNE